MLACPIQIRAHHHIAVYRQQKDDETTRRSSSAEPEDSNLTDLNNQGKLKTDRSKTTKALTSKKTKGLEPVIMTSPLKISTIKT